MREWVCSCDDLLCEVFTDELYVEASNKEEAERKARREFCYSEEECECVCKVVSDGID